MDDLSPEDAKLLDSIATRVVDVGMAVPAILFLESTKPLSFVGSQLLHFFGPIARAFLDARSIERFALLLEDRENIERLLVRVESREAERSEKEHEAKTRAKGEKARARDEKRKRKEETSGRST
jgi:hypothetical protein